MSLSKLTRLQGDSEWVAHHFDHVYWDEPGRLVAAPASGEIELLCELSRHLASPAYLLWVLRQSVAPGRHESPALDLADAQSFLRQHAEFFERDARSDIWLLCEEPEATLVLEEHGLLYLYGPLDEFRATLVAAGLRPGAKAIPNPHAHNFHGEYNAAEEQIKAVFDWIITPLQPEDQ